MSLIRRCDKHECLYENVCPNCDPDKAKEYEEAEAGYQLFKFVIGIIAILVAVVISCIEKT